jgi:putative ABC transport system permease protein
LVLILSVYCYSELTTDSHHVNGEKIFLLNDDVEKEIYGAVLPGVLKEQIDIQIPDVESTLRMRRTWIQPVFKADKGEPINSELVYVDESFFDFFTYKSVSGNLQNALKEPMSLVISKSEAEKIFGTENAVGKTVKLNNEYIFTVTGVFDEPSVNTSLSIKAITPLSTIHSIKYDYSKGDFSNWMQRNFLTFIKLENSEKNIEVGQAISGLFPKEYRENKKMKLTPLCDVYHSKCGLNTPFLNFIKQGNKQRIIILLMVAILILVIAIINYINISSSHRVEMIKQMGVQKVIGASRFNIFSKIIVDAQATFLVSAFLAAVIAGIISSYVNHYTGISYNQKILFSPVFVLTALFSTIALGFISGLLPALRFSLSRPVDNLKNSVSAQKNGSSFRSILVIAQFVIAIVLIAFTALVQKQVKYGCTELGYNNENILAIKVTNQLLNKRDVLKDQLLNQPGIQQVSFAQFFPGDVGLNHNARLFKFRNGEERKIQILSMDADAEFLKMMGMELIMGRMFSDDFSTDKGKVVVNESFLRKNGITVNPIGTTFKHGQHDSEIVGVVKDFHFRSINIPISPLVITNSKPNHLFLPLHCLIKVQAANFNILHNVVERTKEICGELSPEYPIEVAFMDNGIENMYKSEVEFRHTFTLFAGSAILICCLGIFALSLFASQQRTKEIGIRKVNGAKVSEILNMLNKDFIKWVIMAIVIAIPMAYFAMNKWLENFAYKTELSWWIFALAGLLALGISLLTVSWQSWKAATRNPVEALRYE